jgi:2-dehydro-3-deoxyglucarate aldolase/4-hydroxy-2-oxoheptanedioate aldolase
MRNGDLLLGTILTLPSPETAELLSQAGFDWLFVDMEHTSLGVKDVQRILQAVGKEFPCLVRVPVMDKTWIKKVLESGPAGIIVPHVNAPEDADKILRWSKYPPEGTRSVGISRAQGYGMNLQDYMTKANQTLVVLPQVEHIEAVKNLESFVKIPGLSAIFVGPYDLSGSVGKLGKVEDPEVQGMIQEVHAVCSNAGMVTGIFGGDAEEVKSYIDIGYSLVAVGTDTSYLSKSVQDTLRSLRR